ncbi:FmdE family protein [Desulfovibrio sp. UCD-KL4C]|uniref:FmdE family protein n=1 Tax=Desulfovibrio sp. UCD-KL4C TaxID=2578120 RepID=UPI0025C0C025|nr:FmdE family protein [Desulfovibrio sp. UCD-KL4C]
MNIESYTFQEFKNLAQNFHGYAAPGLLIGGYMVAMAKRHIPEGTLFEAVVETTKCLPDAVQLLTLCSTGNNWMKVTNLGRYALSIGDKYTGEGVRVSIDPLKLEVFPEIRDWFFKRKPKHEQDVVRLEQEIEQAGDTICKVEKVIIKPTFLGHKPMEDSGVCSVCGEAYPLCDGPICRGCQGQAPYVMADPIVVDNTAKHARVVPVAEAVGQQVAHDMTRIEPGQFKGPEFKAGQRISVGDVCRLQKMGRFHVAVCDHAATANVRKQGFIHEDEVAERFARHMAGPGVTYSLPPREGKIDFTADCDGLLCVDSKCLEQFNLVPEVMAASRHDGTILKKGSNFAGTRAVPLMLSEEHLQSAMLVLGTNPLFKVLPLRKAKVGILVTGTEVFKGLIDDKFIPVITAKVTAHSCSVVKSTIVPDDREMMREAIEDIRSAGADLLITTGGLSVDPDDITRQALMENGLSNVLHGVPMLPGTMSLMGTLPAQEDRCKMQVLGVPACALFYKTTFFDIILPRLLAGRDITRGELARMGEGGYCISCNTCTWPKCWFGK